MDHHRPNRILIHLAARALCLLHLSVRRGLFLQDVRHMFVRRSLIEHGAERGIYLSVHHILNIAHVGINFLLTINVNGYDIVIYLAIPHGVLFEIGNVVVV